MLNQSKVNPGLRERRFSAKPVKGRLSFSHPYFFKEKLIAIVAEEKINDQRFLFQNKP